MITLCGKRWLCLLEPEACLFITVRLSNRITIGIFFFFLKRGSLGTVEWPFFFFLTNTILRHHFLQTVKVGLR